jgi:hypothetical protein
MNDEERERATDPSGLAPPAQYTGEPPDAVLSKILGMVTQTLAISQRMEKEMYAMKSRQVAMEKDVARLKEESIEYRGRLEYVETLLGVVA